MKALSSSSQPVANAVTSLFSRVSFCFISLSGSPTGSLPPSLGSHLPFSTSAVIQQGCFCSPKGHWPMSWGYFWLSQLKWREENAIEYPPVQKTISHYTKNYLVQMSDMSRLRNPASTIPNSWSFSKQARLYHMLLSLNIGCFLYQKCLTSRFKKWSFIIQDPTQNVTSSILSFPDPPESDVPSPNLSTAESKTWASFIVDPQSTHLVINSYLLNQSGNKLRCCRCV